MIRNGPKRTMSASGGFELLQMISERDTGQCVSEDAGSPKGWIVRSHISWRGERAFLIRVWKPLPNRRVLKS